MSKKATIYNSAAGVQVIRYDALSHNSNLADSEPGWGSIDKTKLPYRAFVWQAPETDEGKKSTWKYPHHFVINGGGLDDRGVFTTGDMYLHEGGLNAAWAASMGARSGERAPQSVIDHLEEHRDALGKDDSQDFFPDANRFSREKILRSISRPRQWFKVNKEQSIPEVFIYDQIGLDFWGDGLSPQTLINEIKQIKQNTFRLHINSPGGFVYDGYSIYHHLNRLNKRIIVYIDGIAASIASVVAMVGDEIIIPEAGEFMIHDPWSMVIGNSREMRKEADSLDGIKDSILGIYQARTGLSRDRLHQLMADETTLRGPEAYELGFADEVEENKKAAACAFDVLFADSINDNLQIRLDSSRKRQLENALRDAGYTRSEAKAIASGQRDAVSNDNPRDAGSNNGIRKNQTILIV